MINRQFLQNFRSGHCADVEVLEIRIGKRIRFMFLDCVGMFITIEIDDQRASVMVDYESRDGDVECSRGYVCAFVRVRGGYYGGT